MSKVSVEQALTGLIPTLNGPLPPELLELALSLLTRSRSVASSLKSDEEIARPYACAQLACERLKKRLNLPAITSRPPCAPRIYKKLYAYLTSALPPPTTPSQPQTPRKNRDFAPASTRTTPSKTPASGRKTPRSTRGGANTFEEAPEWVMPAIRSLVNAFQYPEAAPHIYTGVEAIFPLLARMSVAAETPSKRGRGTDTGPEDAADTRVLGLIAVIFLYVFTRMKDVEVSARQYEEWREKAVVTLAETPIGRTTSFREISVVAEALMPAALEEGWLGMEWFTNVLPEKEGGEDMEGVQMTEQDTHSRVGIARAQGVRGGSERQRTEYQRWKTHILTRIHEMETA